MPSSLLDLEIPGAYGALDSDAFRANRFVDAHALREIQRSARRLAGRGEYLLQEFWRGDGSDDIETVGGHAFDATANWRRVIGPVIAPRKRHLLTGEVQFSARITSGATALFHIQTEASAAPGPRQSTAPNVVEAVGTGAWQRYTSDAIVLGRQDTDTITVWVTGDGSEAFDTGAFGSPDSGAPDVVTNVDLVDNSATWDGGAINAAAGRIVVQFYNADGRPITAPRTVYAWSSTVLRFNQQLSQDEVRRCAASGVEYRLSQVPGVRLRYMVLREMDEF